MVAGIYGYFDLIKNEFVYIGQSNNIEYRHKTHLKPCRINEQPFHRILQRNPNRYELRILKEGNFSSNLMNALEILYIRRHNTFNDPNKFNYRIGGGRSLLSKESRQLISDKLTGRRHDFDACCNMSKSKNSSGYYRVYLQTKCNTKQGFTWKYRYTQYGKRRVISSVDLLKLKQKIIDNGLPWLVLDESKAKNTCETYGYNFNELN